MTYSLRNVVKPIEMVQVKNLEHPVGILKQKIPAVRGVKDLLSSMSVLKKGQDKRSPCPSQREG
ncbi:hypothetical protein DPMN_132850 [Dreissena polymorpha]|uniref:Uncharacterized protein n=1 Tax=Dreissena polymorpha TaxID=45954 RepID=A0A9D4FT79_DREPO|nr:hypothetical protein DPMN_132850 [Dreissena polymorpha]